MTLLPFEMRIFLSAVLVALSMFIRSLVFLEKLNSR